MSRNEKGVFTNEDGKKYYIPLENNPEVFTELVHKLGVSEKLGFYDVYSLDEPDLVAMIPRPVHALIFISPGDVYNRVREHDKGTKQLFYDGSGDQEPVLWWKQTVGNACGLYAVVHSVASGSGKRFVAPDSAFDNFLKEATLLKPVPRAKAFHDSQILEDAHMAVASKGDSVAPIAEDPIGHHFISFIKGNDGHLYELEGSWGGPIDLGALSEDADMLSEEALDAGVRRYVKVADGSQEFSIVALATKFEGEI